MAAIDLQVLGLAAVAGGEAAHAFSAHMPSHWTTRALVLDGDPAKVRQNVADWRSGYRPALLTGLVIGGGLSLLARSALPIAAAGLVSLLMVWNYESALPASMRKPVLEAVAEALGPGGGPLLVATAMPVVPPLP